MRGPGQPPPRHAGTPPGSLSQPGAAGGGVRGGLAPITPNGGSWNARMGVRAGGWRLRALPARHEGIRTPGSGGAPLSPRTWGGEVTQGCDSELGGAAPTPRAPLGSNPWVAPPGSPGGPAGPGGREPTQAKQLRHPSVPPAKIPGTAAHPQLPGKGGRGNGASPERGGDTPDVPQPCPRGSRGSGGVGTGLWRWSQWCGGHGELG